MMRAGICVAVFAVVMFGSLYSAHAFYAVDDCEGPQLPGQKFDQAFDYDLGVLNATPRNNQFWCSSSTPIPPNTYRCEETDSGVRVCRHYLNPATDFYTCTYFGGSPRIGATPYPGVVFDNCTHSIVPPTVSLGVTPSTITAGNSTTLSWTVANATSCTSSWAGIIAGASGSQTVTPPSTTTYSLTCTGPGGTTGPVNATVIVNPPPDITPPTDPTGLSASAISTSQINLSWTASIDPPPNVSGLAGYRIERCTGSGCTGFVQVGLSAVASYSDTGLAPATTYTYRVRAYDNATNNSGYSNTANATTWTPPDTTPPTTPFLSGSPFSSTQIDLSWTASTDSGSGLSDYRVYRGGTLIATLGTSVTAYSDVGLTPSTLYSYYVVARDVAGNVSNSNTISVTTPAPPDTTPPTFTFSAPAMTLPSGTTSATLAGSTNETATCRYSTTSGMAFTSMTLFATTGGLSHSQSITGLTDGTTYTYYVKCRDGVGNTNTSDFSYMFQVSSPAPDTTPPVISGGSPSGILGAGTTSVTMSAVTNENAYCRYNQGSDVAYGAMTSAFSVTGATTHTVSLTGLTNGSSYLYYVRCQDNPAGNENTAGYAITFSVAFPANVNPVALISVLPSTSGTAPFTVAADGSASYDTDGTIVQYIWTWGDGSPDTIGTPTASHTYTSAGTYTITLRVIDNQGGSGTTTQSIIVTAAVLPPPPPPAVSFCIAECTTDADCASSGGVCGLSGVCVAPGSIGGGPVRSNGYLTLLDGTMSQPAGLAVFPSSTKTVVMSLETDVNAECQYTTFVNTPYDGSAMQAFSSTGSTKHAVTLTGITGTLTTSTTTTPKTYDYYVRCKDLTTEDVNTSDYPISFTISGATVVSGPDPYTCFINKNFVRSAIPYVFDICVPR